MKPPWPLYFLSGMAAALAVADVFWVDIGWPTIGLLAIAFVPWAIRYVKEIELPGGLKVSLHQIEELARRAENLGGGDEAVPETKDLIDTIRSNPTLSLAALRIELERRLRTLARNHGIASAPMSASKLSHLLHQHHVLSDEERSLMLDLLPAMNRAAHAEDVDDHITNWAIDAALPLLAALDRKIDRGVAVQ